MEDRKQEESGGRYDEEKYRLVLETASDAVVSINHVRAHSSQTYHSKLHRPLLYPAPDALESMCNSKGRTSLTFCHLNGFMGFLLSTPP
jgi:hypothetical protein